MPHILANGLQTHYQWDGLESGPVLLFSNSLGSDLSMWDDLIPLLQRHFRLLRYDTRGHGLSRWILVKPLPLKHWATMYWVYWMRWAFKPCRFAEFQWVV